MKAYLKYSTLICMLNIAINFSSNAQSPASPFSIAWQKTYGGSQLEDNDYLSNTMAATPDGGYIFTGDTWSNDGDVSGNHGMQDAWVCKIDALGNIQWQRCIGGTNVEWGQHIITTNDGGYLVGGETLSNDGDISGNHGKGDVYLAKLNSAGNLQWVKVIGGSKYEDCGKFMQNPDGTYMFVGLTYSNDGDVSGNHGKSDTWVVKLDVNGNILWQKCYGGSGDDCIAADHQTQIIRSAEGGYLIVTAAASDDQQVNGFHGKVGKDIGDGWYVKIDDNGNIQWSKCFGSPSWDFIENTIQLSDGSYLSSGGIHGAGGDVPGNNGVGNADWWLLKISQSGNLIWSRNYGGSEPEAIHGKVLQLPNGDLILPSGTRSNDHDCIGISGAPDLWIVKTDSMGNILSYNIWGGPGYENLSFAVLNGDGSVTAACMTDPTEINDAGHDANSQLWILKLNPNPADTFALTTTSLSQNIACPGYSPFAMNVSFIKRGTFNAGNIFTAELSDANGSFNSPVPIGTLNSTSAGNISCTIPGGLPAGGYYAVRIRSSNPSYTGITSGHLLNVQSCAPAAELISNIQSASSVQLKWSTVPCAIQYKLQYSKSPNASWNNVNTTLTTDTVIFVSGLSPASTYYWRVLTKCASTPNIWSDASLVKLFSTPSLRLASEDDAVGFTISPNPVSVSATITFNIPVSENVSLKIVDLTGQLIQILADENFKAGENEYTWDVNNLKPGFYFLQIEAGDYSSVKKISVIK